MFRWLFPSKSPPTPKQIQLEDCPFPYIPRPIDGSYTYLREEIYLGKHYLIGFDDVATRIAQRYKVRLRLSMFRGVYHYWVLLDYNPLMIEQLQDELSELGYAVCIATVTKPQYRKV